MKTQFESYTLIEESYFQPTSPVNVEMSSPPQMSSPPREISAPVSTRKTPSVGPVALPTDVSGGQGAGTEGNSGTPAWLVEAKLRRQSRQPKMELSTPKQVIY